MQLLGIHVGVPSSDELARLLDAAAAADLTYDFVGSTLSAAGSSRSSETRRELVVGRGDEVFSRACEALRLWLPQRGLGGFVYPDDAPIAVGTNLLAVLRSGPVAVVVPDRVVAVVDEDDRFGFAYGTLPGHAEQGEESFLIERGADGEVRCTIRVDARPATIPARLAAPAVRWIQRWAMDRYLDAVRQHATAA